MATDPLKALGMSLFILIVAGTVTPAIAGNPAGAVTPVRVRINTTHGIENARGAVTDAGLMNDTDVIVTSSSEFNGRPWLSPDKLILDARSTGATIMSSSFSGWEYLYDTAQYLRMAPEGMVHVYAYEPRKPQPHGAPPPAVFVTANLSEGKTGGGIEFGVPKGYMQGKGQSTTPSGVTAQLAGLMACIKYRHPDWNWFDIKAALRMTAGNFPTGYDPQRSGYGTISFQSANDQTDPLQFTLFPPAAVMQTAPGNRVIFAINSFKQTRRSADALFRFRMKPLPTRNELTIEELKAMGGELLFTGDRSTSTNSYSIQVPGSEPTYFVWLTRDAGGAYSRIEPYSIFGPVLFAQVTTMYGPRVKSGNNDRSGIELIRKIIRGASRFTP